jgi:dTDP-4-dehydrorhamnose 3,5-epimerase
VVSYLCSSLHMPARDHGIHPLDLAIAVDWPTTDRAGATLTPRLSPKDAAAPTLAEIRDLGLLPTYEAARA